MMQKAMFIQLAAGLLIGGSLGALMGYLGKCSTGTCPLTANPFRGAFIGAMMGGMLAFSTGASRVSPEGNRSGYSALHIESATDFRQQVLNAGVPVLVDFYSDTCPPCRKLAPTVERLAEDYEGRAVVAKINVGQAPELAQQYGVQGIPAVLFFSKGQVVQRLVGLRAESTYTDVLDRLINAG